MPDESSPEETAASRPPDAPDPAPAEQASSAPEPARDPDTERRERRRARLLNYVAVAISVLSLLATAVQAYTSNAQVAVARQQMEDARRQFTENGPVLAATTVLRVNEKTIRAGEFPVIDYPEPQFPVVDRAFEAGSAGVFLVMTLYNSGRSPAIVTDTAFPLGPAFTLHTSLYEPNSYTIYCAGQKAANPVNCATYFPVTLQPGGSFEMRFPLAPLRQALERSGSSAGGTDLTITAPNVPGSPLPYHAPLVVRP